MNNTAAPVDERQAFEAWYRQQYGEAANLRLYEGNYVTVNAIESWRIWQAALSARQPTKSLSATVADALRPFCGKGQKVIWREPFRWHDDGGVMPNHYEMFTPQQLADGFGYQLIEDCGCAAIIAAAPTGEEPK